MQTILEINQRIIDELKNSDCFLFVNFRREKLSDESFRGSLFSNQELAIAYCLGFEQLLVVNQRGVASEGLLRYMGINTPMFGGYEDCVNVVESVLGKAGWRNDYSRRLRAGALHTATTQYNAATGLLTGVFLHLDIHNGRPDVAALECTTRLARLKHNGAWIDSPIRSPLKATGRNAYAHTIFPKSHEAFDILVVGSYLAPYTPVPSASGLTTMPTSGSNHGSFSSGVFLNSAFDAVPAPSLPITVGAWELEYEIVAIGFPRLTVSVRVDLTEHSMVEARVASQRCD